MNLGIQNKVALVTGSGRGIGLATARALGREGAKICISDIMEENGLAAVKELSDEGIEAFFVPCDVSKEEDIINLFRKAEEKFGGVDILVNNAGISPKNYTFDQIPYDEFLNVLKINLLSVYLCSKAAFPYMKEKGWGRIVNLSSQSALTGGNVPMPHYVSTKGGIISITKSFARRMGPYGITSNCVAPGRIESEMTSNLDPARKEEIRKSIPLGRMGTVEEVGDVITFLASEAAAYVTGVCLEINGGWIV